MKEKVLTYLAGLLAVLVIPYLGIVFVNGVDTALSWRTVNVENLLPVAVSLQIAPKYQKEMIKAQTIVARSNIYGKLEENSLKQLLGEIKEQVWEVYDMWELPDPIYEKAVEETEGEVLMAEGKLCLVPYHELSNGRTRDGEEVLHEDRYAYLKAVDSSVDRESPDYVSSIYLSAQQMPKELEIIERDSSGYVMGLKTEDTLLEGEAFRRGLRLASADFSVQKIHGEYRFLCKGKGHGLGISQYGGNEMAKEGSSCKEILETYFPSMELEKVQE